MPIFFSLMILIGLAMAWNRNNDVFYEGLLSGWRAVGTTLIAIGIVGLICLWLSPGHARDLDGRYAASPLKPWFDQLKSSNGIPCCSDADGTAVSDVDWRSKNGHYQVRLDGQWIDVPDEAVITEPNRAGRTMVWPRPGEVGPLSIRCFMPGSMS